MPGNTDHTGNIFLYLTPEEIKEIPKNTIEGILIKYPKIKRQGTFKINLDNKISGINTVEDDYWGVKDNFNIDIFIGRESYQNLIDNKKAYSRKSTGGSEIFIYNSDYLDFTQEENLKNINFYIENRDKISDTFG